MGKKVMKKLGVMTVIILGLISQHQCLRAANPNCSPSNLKPLNVRIHGAYQVNVEYFNCDANRITGAILGAGQKGSWSVPSNSTVRVEVVVWHGVSPGGESTRNAAYETVGPTGLSIDCGGTTFINRKCDCQRPGGGSGSCKTT